jgi:hypothetical protein
MDGGGNGEAWRGAVSPAARYAESGGASLTWENLTAVLPGGGGRATKKLLAGLYGYAVPGRVVAVMGPSGSGKSTLLDSLSGNVPTSCPGPFVFLQEIHFDIPICSSVLPLVAILYLYVRASIHGLFN